MHHLICDGWSLGVFCRDLSAFYNASISGTKAVLPPLRLQYSDYVHWQKEVYEGCDGGGKHSKERRRDMDW
jgi:hypothetical protein